MSAKEGNTGDTKKSSNETEFIDDVMLKEYGYDLYPERKSAYERTFAGMKVDPSRDNRDKIACEQRVYRVILRSPIIKLMLGALKSSGCPFDFSRHVSCELCDKRVHGGYDFNMNQVVICQNTANTEGYIQGILAHEMIHMFDACNHKVDFKNLDHVACTEIRAANMTHCSWLSGFVRNDFSPFKLRKAHQDCVKKKAYLSLMAARNITEQEGIEAIDRVFDRCYNDLEPIGRRPRKTKADTDLACEEAMNLGYL